MQISLWPAKVTSRTEALEHIRRLGELMTQADIARATGIHQGQVSRVMQGEFKRLTGRALELCNYAKQLLESRKDVSEAEQIKDLALSLSDGTREGNEAAIAALRALSELMKRRQRRPRRVRPHGA
jgi:transcriptional regulator with XRE-family HTH domain